MNSREYGKPIRPPRSSRTPRETTGHLMKIISTLSNSQGNADRDKEKEKLEKDYSDSDKKLVRLVKVHQEDLTVTMQAFGKISSNIITSKDNCEYMEEKFTRCKTLLQCRRDELKRLWLEVVEHKRVLQMLHEIEHLMEVPEIIESYLERNLYLMSTKLLVSSIAMLEGSLSATDALKDLKMELYAKREELHQILVRELHILLYVSSSSHILKRFKRHGSGRVRGEVVNAASKTPSKRIEQVAGNVRECTANHLVNISNIWNGQSWTENSFLEIEETIQLSIFDVVECVSLLHRIPETVEILKERCQQELLSIVRRTAQHVAEASQNLPYSCQHSFLGSMQNKEQQYLLLDLLDLIFEQFKCVIRSHKSLLKNLQQKKGKYEDEDMHTYEIADIWSKMQAVLEIFVGEYVDIHNSSAIQPPPSSYAKVQSAVDISSFFLRKRNQRLKSFALFKFDSSSHAISMKTYLQEQKEALKEKGEVDTFDSEKIFISPPANKNITVVFRPLTKFIMEITEELQIEEGVNCPLSVFLYSCVKVFLGQIAMEANHVTENASKSLENWRTVSDLEVLKSADVDTILLHSALNMDSSVKELKELIYALPLYSNHFLHIICSMLQSYRESCQAAYTSLIQPHSEDKRIISSSWARDKDISRLLRSLPNWTNLKEKDCSDFEESPEEVRLRNKKESEILIANLSGDTLISPQEILSDPHHLRNLALLHESMDWLGSRILAFACSLPKQQCSQTNANNSQEFDDVDIDPLPEGTIESLTRTGKDFGNLADTCLLVLHLEVRVHCFYHLQPLAAQGCYATRLDSQEPDPEIVKLNNDLSKLDESLQSALKPCNIKYVFEGLGELISTILINSSSKIKRINENGIKKMIRNIFALQQNLTGITMFREVALDRARQYFDLLNRTPEEILSLIVENGPQFQELEYSTAFHLLQRSSPGSDTVVLNNYLDRLHQILNEVAVSV